MNTNYQLNELNKLSIKELQEIKRGEILFIALGKEGTGSEQINDRYGICIQNNIANRFSNTIIVAFITSKTNKHKLSVHVETKAGEFGLPKDSVIMLEQIRTIDKARIKSRIGIANESVMKQVDNAIDISVKDLPPVSLLNKLPETIKEHVVATLKQIKKYEITIKTMKDEEIEKSVIEFILAKKINILNQFIKYCTDHHIDYKKFYVINEGVNKEITL